MQPSSRNPPVQIPGKRLSRDEFDQMAARLEVDADIRDELFPMVQDLLAFAHLLNQLAPELGQEISVDALSGGAQDGAS